jgi:uracil-DNA glycosylase
MTLNKPTELPVKLYKQAASNHAGSLIMSNLRGNPKSSVLLIAPPCSAEEYNQGVPFCNLAAKEFHTLLHDHGYDTQRHFLVVSCSVYGEKPSKHSTELVKGFIAKCAAFNCFEYYICVGDEAFKYIFGAGKKPSGSAIYGSTVYVPETGHKPLFVFPSPAPLAVLAEGSDWEMRRAERIRQAYDKKYYQYARQFTSSLKQHQIKL